MPSLVAGGIEITMDEMTIYNKLPVWGQNLACYREGRRIKKTRFNRTFWKYLEEYEERNNWSYERLCDCRDKKLQQMIQHCYETVPYYTKLFDDGGINPENIRTLEDLEVLPIVTKEMINANPEEFISSAVSKEEMVNQHTSGTTGSGFIFKTTYRAICEQWAVWWRYRRKLGIAYGTLCGQLGGRSVVPITSDSPPFYRWNKPNNIMYFSAYHMSEKNLAYYINDLRSYHVAWLHGYPSAISILSEFAGCHDEELSLKFVTTGAENLLESQRLQIKTALGVEAYQHYGLAEAVANFSEDQEHQMLIDEDFAAVEFVKIKGMNNYEIVGTSLSNYAMPLIRYRTNDLGETVDTIKGRLVKSLDGRIEDCVTLSSGAKIGRLDHIFKDLTHVKEAQIIQKSLDMIQVNLVKSEAYGPADEKQLRQELNLRLSGIDIVIDYVDKIQRTPAGKLRFVISEI